MILSYDYLLALRRLKIGQGLDDPSSNLPCELSKILRVSLQKLQIRFMVALRLSGKLLLRVPQVTSNIHIDALRSGCFT